MILPAETSRPSASDNTKASKASRSLSFLVSFLLWKKRMGMNSGVSPGLPMARVQGHAERQPVKVALEPCLRMATLPGLPWDCRWLDAVKPGLREFPRCKRHTKFHAQCHTPFGSLQIPRARSYSAFVRGHVCRQSFGGISALLEVGSPTARNQHLVGQFINASKTSADTFINEAYFLRLTFGESYLTPRDQTQNGGLQRVQGSCYA